MSDAKYFAKSKASELRAEIDQAKKKLKPHARVLTVLKKLVANIILGKNDLAALMAPVAELMAIDDVAIRKQCSFYVAHYAPLNPKDAPLALLFYTRFLADPNPVLRALALKTVSQVNLPAYVALGVSGAKRLLEDPAARVRTTAAFAVARMFLFEPQRVAGAGLVEDLNALLYDDNATVVATALAALSSVTEAGPQLGLTIDANHLLTLARGLHGANEWRQCYVLNALMAFVPQDEADAVAVMDAVLPCLVHANLAVVLHTVKVVVYLSNYVAQIESAFPTLPHRLGAALMLLLNRRPEVQFLVLRNVILLLLGKHYLVDVPVEQFFWAWDDPIYIKDTKLEIIYLMAADHNIAAVFRELEEYATEIDVRTARKAIRAFGNLAVKLPSVAPRCVDILLDLVSDGVPHVVQEAAPVVKNIVRRYPGQYDAAVAPLLRHFRAMDEPEAMVAVVWLAGQYSAQLAHAEAVLRHFVTGLSLWPLEVQCATITAAVKYYLHQPVAGESLVLAALQHATEADHPDVRDRGFFYWRMVTADANSGRAGGAFQEHTKEVVLDPTPQITAENENIDPAILEELELNIGTLASVYLKSVKHVFRYAKPKHLTPSPALQKRRKNEPPLHLTASQIINHATGRPIDTPSNPNHFKPLPEINRHGSMSTFRSGDDLADMDRKGSFSGKADTDRKESFSRKLSRKALIITRLKH